MRILGVLDGKAECEVDFSTHKYGRREKDVRRPTPKLEISETST